MPQILNCIIVSICREEVTDDDAAISCDQCNLWTHAMCANISDAEYDTC